jgi:hypothetical protein
MGAEMGDAGPITGRAGSRQTTSTEVYLSRLQGLNAAPCLSPEEIFSEKEDPSVDAVDAGSELRQRSIREVVLGALKSLIADHRQPVASDVVFSAISYFLEMNENVDEVSAKHDEPTGYQDSHFRPDIALLLASLAEELEIPIGSPSLWELALKMANIPDPEGVNSEVVHMLLRFEPTSNSGAEIDDELREKLTAGLNAIGCGDLVAKLTPATLPVRPAMPDEGPES